MHWRRVTTWQRVGGRGTPISYVTLTDPRSSVAVSKLKTTTVIASSTCFTSITAVEAADSNIFRRDYARACAAETDGNSILWRVNINIFRSQKNFRAHSNATIITEIVCRAVSIIIRRRRRRRRLSPDHHSSRSPRAPHESLYARAIIIAFVLYMYIQVLFAFRHHPPRLLYRRHRRPFVFPTDTPPPPPPRQKRAF